MSSCQLEIQIIRNANIYQEMISIYRPSNHNKRVSILRPAVSHKIWSQAQT